MFEDLKDLKAKVSRMPVTMPGFPGGSFYYQTYYGKFYPSSNLLTRKESFHFNKLHVITDAKNQVVGVQYTCEAPPETPVFGFSEIRIFNFLQFRRAGMSKALVGYKVAQTEGSYRLLTELSVEKKCKEINLLILPKPTLSLIQHSLRKME